MSTVSVSKDAAHQKKTRKKPKLILPALKDVVLMVSASKDVVPQVTVPNWAAALQMLLHVPKDAVSMVSAPRDAVLQVTAPNWDAVFQDLPTHTLPTHLTTHPCTDLLTIHPYTHHTTHTTHHLCTHQDTAITDLDSIMDMDAAEK